MARRIAWSEEAVDDFDSAITYVALDSKRSAGLVAQRIENAIAGLATMPIGRQGRVAGSYEKPVQKTPYVIAYSLSDTTIRVLRIIHGARDWPDDEWPAE